jgi:hypothetical protein
MISSVGPALAPRPPGGTTRRYDAYSAMSYTIFNPAPANSGALSPRTIIAAPASAEPVAHAEREGSFARCGHGGDVRLAGGHVHLDQTLAHQKERDDEPRDGNGRQCEQRRSRENA